MSDDDANRTPEPARVYDPRGHYEGAGSKSEEDLYTDKNRMKNGFEMDSATSVGGSEADEKHQRLQKVNAGAEPSDGEWSMREANRDVLRVTTALCSSLDLNTAEQEEVLATMQRLDLSSFGSQRGIETVALGVIRFRVPQMRSEHVDLDQVDDDQMSQIFISRQEAFKSCIDDFDLSMSDLNTINKGIRDQLGESVSRLSGSGEVVAGPDPNLPRRTSQDRSDEWWDAQFSGEHGLSDKPDEFWEIVSESFIESIPDRYRHHIPEKHR
jgi:hypothetical protein